MAWDFDRSKERVEAEKKRIREIGITVKPLTREMDLSNLSPTDVRLVHGVHMYTDITNFDALLEDPLLRRDSSKRLYRFVNAVVREQRHIAQVVFDGDKIQVQGSRFHGLLYKPYDDDSTLSSRSMLLAVTNHLMFTKVLPQVFRSYPSAEVAVGMDLGDCIVANIGVAGERELISIGAPANHAAKILGDAGTIVIGNEFFDQLPEEAQELFEEVDGSYGLQFSQIVEPEQLLEDNGIDWSVQESIKRIQEYLDATPLEDVTIEDARERIDVYRLGPKVAKSCSAASFFVDIDGYTKLIDNCTGDLDQLTRVLTVLHLFRYELRQVIFPDFDGVFIQHQGDRLQAVLQVPAGNEQKILQRATDICISLNSSVEEVLKAILDTSVSVAIGSDFGNALIGRIGVKGDLDVVCLGHSIHSAEEIQSARKGNEIGISIQIYDAIQEKNTREFFNWNADGHYVAKDLTWVTLEDSEDSAAYNSSKEAAFTSQRNIVVGPSIVVGSHPLKVTRNWAE